MRNLLKKYTTFKIPLLEQWLIVVNTPELIEELRKAPDDKMSVSQAIADVRISSYFASCPVNTCLTKIINWNFA